MNSLLALTILFMTVTLLILVALGIVLRRRQVRRSAKPLPPLYKEQ